MSRTALVARRNELALTQEDLSQLAQIHERSILRYEAGESTPRGASRRRLAKALQWDLSELDAALNGNHQTPHPAHGWWSNYEALEQSATSVRSWEPMLIGGLLQVEEYAADLLDGNEELVSRRLDRQRLVTQPRDPAELVGMFDESALHRMIGGSEVMAHQLSHLLTAAERPNITIQVLPLSAPTRAIAKASRGSMVILTFPWSGGLVHLEHEGGARTLDSHAEVESHIEAYSILRELALTPADSLELIRHRLEDMAI